jgi:hypothetical protein
VKVVVAKFPEFVAVKSPKIGLTVGIMIVVVAVIPLTVEVKRLLPDV